MLIAEALTEAAEVPVGERYRSNEWRMRYREARLAEAPGALYETLRTAIDRDLSAAAESGAPPPALTRALCVRAAQFEVLLRELPEVVALSIKDLATGTSAPPIDAIDRPWTDVITGLRDDRSLPERLRAPDPGAGSSGPGV